MESCFNDDIRHSGMVTNFRNNTPTAKKTWNWLNEIHHDI